MNAGEQYSNAGVLVVIPTLNEAAHIAGLVEQLVALPAGYSRCIVVADGGSTDGTVEIVRSLEAQYAEVHFLHNPQRLQSAAVNLAVGYYGKQAEYLVRMDAHAGYPDRYVDLLREEAMVTGADSVVVSMHTVGRAGFQKAAAVAQNSRLGNGGSSHRNGAGEGRWVEHGHHALMRISAFQAVGGYDESFSHNEDAELDMRFMQSGYRIWLTAKTAIDYYPRSNIGGLFQQYWNYGSGRCRTLLKHRKWPRIRQMIPVGVLPAALLALLCSWTYWALLPVLCWALLCMVYGACLGAGQGVKAMLLTGPAAMVMHFGWSVGFWQRILRTMGHAYGR